MAQTIKLKRSNTAGNLPTTSDLALGEVAINTKDGKFFLRKHVDGTDSGDAITAYAPQGLNVYGTQTFEVKVITKTASHPQFGTGSANGYSIDGLESPFIVLVPGNTYKFDQSDSSNTGHPLAFYLEEDKTTSYSTGVTTNGTPGSSGAYTQIVASTNTPQVLYYQCSSHAYMGSGSYTLSDAIADGKVGTAQLAANAVTSAKIAANSVDSSELVTGSIDTIHIGDSQVTGTKIADNTIATGNIADNAVDATKIASNSILTRHIDDNQIGIDQLNVTDGTSGQALTTDGAGTLSFSTVASSLSAASDTDITSPSSGQILVHDGTDSFDNVSISGDATLSSAGVLTIATNAIESTMIAQNSILTKHIDDNQIGIDQLNVTDGTSGQVLTTDGAGTLSFSTVSGGGSQNLFSTFAVSGQSDIVADSTTDTLTVAAGSGISLTTNASTDTLTITATGSGLSANAVTSAYLASNAVLARHIATDAVGSSELAATGVSAGTYGSSTATPQFTVDTDGRITSVGNVTISSSGGGGSAGLNQVINTYEATGDGSTVAFDTGTTITTEDLTWVFIDGVYQEKGAYSTSGSTVTFSAAPPNGTSIEILNLSSITTGGAFDHNSFSGDGSTTDFTLANTPDSETDLIVFIDGVYQNNNAFNVSGTTLSFDTAPANGTTVIAYSIGGVVTGKANIVNTFNGDSSTTDFTLSIDPKDEKNTIVFVGGVYQPKATYSISGTTLTFSEAPPTGTGNIEVSISQITTTTQLAADILDGNTFTGSTELTGELTATEFIGDLRGATLFKGQAGEALSKGEVVYISGISGNTTVVSKADADDAAKMPAFGVVAADASLNASVSIYTFGRLSGLDTSSFSEGDELFVSTTAGELTDTAPTGESSKLQKIAKVTKSDNAAGSIFIMGAGRSNAVPNLDDGDIFIGNGSNQAVSSSLNTLIDSRLSSGNVATIETSGNITVGGDLTVSGSTTTLNTATLDVEDINITVNAGSGDTSGTADGAGITIQDAVNSTTDATILWDQTNSEFDFSHAINITGGLTTSAASDLNSDINISGTVSLDGTANELRFYEGSNYVGFEAPALSGDQIWVLPDSDGTAGYALKTDGSGNLSWGLAGGNAFETIAIAGQSSVVADSSSDTLTLAAGTGITLTTNASTDTITITNSSLGANAFGTIAVSGQSDVDADSTSDTLTLVGQNGVAITTDASTDTVTIDGRTSYSPFTTDLFTTANASTTDFVLSVTPSSEDNLIVFVEGVYQNKNSYSLTSNTLKLSGAPGSGEEVVVHIVSDLISGQSLVRNNFTGVLNQTDFTLTLAPMNANNTFVYMDGVYQEKSEYSVSGTTLSFTTAPAAGDSIEVIIPKTTELQQPAVGSIDDATMYDTTVLIPQTVTSTTVESTSATTIATHAAATYRTIKYLVQCTQGTDYHSTEINLIHDGSTVYITEYGTLFDNASLGTFNATISSGNILLQITPGSATSMAVKVVSSAIPV